MKSFFSPSFLGYWLIQHCRFNGLVNHDHLPFPRAIHESRSIATHIPGSSMI
jgi:hypothetical protein